MSVTGTTHIDRALQNLSIKKTSASEFNLIADMVAPVVPVKRSSDKYYIYGEEYRKKHDLRKTDRTPSRMLHRSQSTDTYTTEDYGAKDLVTEKDMADFDSPLDAKMDTTQFLTEVMMMDQEQRVAELFTTSGNYAGSNVVTLSGTDQWDDYTNSTPLQDILTGRVQVKSAGRKANTVIIPYDVAVVLANHPNYKSDVSDIVNQVEGLAGNAKTANSGLLPKLQGLEVLVPDAVVDEAADGATADNADVWGKHVWIGYVSPEKRAKLKTVSFAMQFKHDKYGGIRRVYTQDAPEVDIHGVEINVEESVDEKIIAADLGYLIVDVIS